MSFADGFTALLWERVTASVRASRRYPVKREPDGTLTIDPIIAPAVIDRIEVFALNGTPLWHVDLRKAVADGDVIIITVRPVP